MPLQTRVRRRASADASGSCAKPCVSWYSTTGLNNDRIRNDLKHHIEREFGIACSDRYRAIAGEGHGLIYIHQEEALDDVERRYPAQRYALVDDKLHILAPVKKAWGDRSIPFSPEVTR